MYGPTLEMVVLVNKSRHHHSLPTRGNPVFHIPPPLLPHPLPPGWLAPLRRPLLRRSLQWQWPHLLKGPPQLRHRKPLQMLMQLLPQSQHHRQRSPPLHPRPVQCIRGKDVHVMAGMIIISSCEKGCSTQFIRS